MLVLYIMEVEKQPSTRSAWEVLRPKATLFFLISVGHHFELRVAVLFN